MVGGRVPVVRLVSVALVLLGVTLSGLSVQVPTSAAAPRVHSSPVEVRVSAGGTIGPAVTRVAPLAGTPIFDWGLAYIIYGPGDDTTHFMGEGAAMVVDDATRNMTTFGGEGSGGLSDYTVNYNVTTGEFAVATLSPGPSARTNASFAGVPGRDFAVLFGGLTSLSTHESANDTWVYYFGNQTWQNVTHAIAPPPRESAAFAVNATGNTALLEGGWDPHYAVNGSGATVLWNDTWTLNLTTFDWTARHPAHTPAPMYGSGMIWQNVTDSYELFGGCGFGCSNELWSYSGQPADWRVVSASGGPTARAGAAWAWDGEDGLGVLYGGFTDSGSGTVALADGDLFSPATRSWSPIEAGGGPGPRFDAPNVWADFPGCEGLNLVGGNVVLSGPPQNANVLEPINAPAMNCFPALISGNGTPPPPCSVKQSPLLLRVINNLTGQGVANATVQLNGGCVDRTATTDGLGYLNLSIPAPDNLTLAASAPGYRDNELSLAFLPNSTVEVILPLAPYPALHVRTFGIESDGQRVPLGGVTIDQGTAVVLGTTGAAGYLNVSHVISSTGLVNVVASRGNYSTAQRLVHLPFEGATNANLTLLVAGDLDVQIVGNGSELVPLGRAGGSLADRDAGAGPPLYFTANDDGWINFTELAAANYTLSSGYAGYFANSTTFYHSWVNTTVVTLVLPGQVGAVVDVLVRSSSTGQPLHDALVNVLHQPGQITGPAGWANFSGIAPAGLYEISASASGYSGNYSWIELNFSQVVDPFLIELRPIPGCGTGGCPSTVSGPSVPPFGYLSGGTFGSLLIIVAPAALLGGGLLYAAVALRQESRFRMTSPRPPVRRGASP